MPKFTPGPWQVRGVRMKWRQVGSDQVLDSHAVGPDGDEVALVFYASNWHNEQLANARLIAAAPSMYETLIEIANLAVGNGYLCEIIAKRARTILDKADGR